MPIVTVRYTLPDEQHDYDCARLGAAACNTLCDIDQQCRSLVKHGDPSQETAALAEEIRQMIRDGCVDALEV